MTKPAYWLMGVVLALLSCAAGAATRYVGDCGTPNTTTIAAASAAASAGDTINICPGTYNESVTVDKAGLTIKGSTGNAADVTVQRSGNWESPFNLNAANITLKNMTLVATNGGVGAVGPSPGPMVFENLIVSADKYGFFLNGNGAGAVTFKSVAVTALTDWAIYIGWQLTGAHTLEGVTATGKTAGIFADGGVASLTNVIANSSAGNAIGINNNKHSTVFAKVTMTAPNGMGINIPRQGNNSPNSAYTFTDVTATTGNRGISIDVSGKVTMTNVTATSANGDGIYLYTEAIGAHEFTNVTASGGGGITLQKGAASLKNVTATGTSGSAIWMGNTYPATLDTVTANAPNHRGIEIANTDAVDNAFTFTNVKVTSKSRGINVARSGKVTMNGITVNTPDHGIWFEDGADGAHELSNLDIMAGKGALSAPGLAKVEDFKITATSDVGIGIGTTHDATIRRGTISAPDRMGIYIGGTDKKKVTIQDVTLTTGWDYGIMLMRSSEALIQRVCVSGMISTGIYTDEGAEKVTIRDSQFGNSGSGVMIFSDPGKKATVTNNAFLKATTPRASSNSSKHHFNQNYWQGVAGGAKYKDGNVEDMNTLGSSPVVGCYSGAAALSAYYKFDDTWGLAPNPWSPADTLEDSSGKGMHATLSDIGDRTIAQESSPASGLKPDTCKAANINKAGNFLTPSTLDVNTASGGKNSVSFWMYWDGGFDAYNFTNLFTWKAANYALTLSKYREEMGNGVIGFATGNNIDVYGVTADGLANGWHHVAAVFNNGDITKSKLYIDGVKKKLKSYGTPGTRSAVTTGIIGGAGGWGDFDWSGKLDNFKIYKGAITRAQIAADMAETVNCGTPPIEPTKPANFNCVESGASASNGHLYTKLAGTAFSFDVVALKSDGSVETAYASDASKNVTVELVDGSGDTVCASRAAINPAISQTLTFTAANQGRKATSMTVAKAYTDLRCRVTDASQTPSVTGCSIDNFAVRPGAVTITTTAATAAPSATATPTVKAGNPFTVRAATSTAATDGYAGALALDTGRLTAQVTTQADTRQSGGAVGALTPASLVANDATLVNNATYTEVGYLYLADGAYRDDGFAAVDQPSGDCVSGSTSVTLSGGKYGCSIGNTAAVSFGRFIPHHFDTTVVNACAGGFTYSGQPFPLTVTAKNLAGGTTTNYMGGFAKTVTLSDANGAAGAFSPASLAAGDFTNGEADHTTTPSVSFTFTSKQTAPATLKVRGTDDEASSADGTEGTTPLRSGRLWLGNAYGSDRQDLRVPFEAQYWNGNSFVKNTLDSCTSIDGDNIGLGQHQPVGFANSMNRTHIPAGPFAVTNGAGSFVLAMPAPTGTPASPVAGSVDIVFDLGSTEAPVNTTNSIWQPTQLPVAGKNLPWLRSKWYGSTWDRDPTARATYGIFGSSEKKGVIYLRESY